MAQTIGVIALWWRGKQYDTQKGVRFRLSGQQNNDVNAGRRTLRSQQYNPGMVQATVLITPDVSLTEFDPSLGEGELQLQADTGQTWTISDAYVKTLPDAQDNGQAQINWTFNTYQELT
ncbi:phage tail tube protein [Gluconobacter japonicus]|uniref:phage tail tube protein n=1 Tax=Gluconobacter japonicus TaxID=376620 RepID=UPI003D2D3D91